MSTLKTVVLGFQGKSVCFPLLWNVVNERQGDVVENQQVVGRQDNSASPGFIGLVYKIGASVPHISILYCFLKKEEAPAFFLLGQSVKLYFWMIKEWTHFNT